MLTPDAKDEVCAADGGSRGSAGATLVVLGSEPSSPIEMFVGLCRKKRRWFVVDIRTAKTGEKS